MKQVQHDGLAAEYKRMEAVTTRFLAQDKANRGAIY